ncbi:hypothetical protein [uncultured Endozoicomonas sp.]|uniref:hypothetical protein n=1 Tax=uncultured Endozoicomonas sp. TaxID=432652 RepID=UPI0026393DFF|nr:hypothetical protein [uncultured Endozoicomonas sp.]
MGFFSVRELLASLPALWRHVFMETVAIWLNRSPGIIPGYTLHSGQGLSPLPQTTVGDSEQLTYCFE